MSKDLGEVEVGQEIGSLQYRIDEDGIKAYLGSLDNADPWYLNGSPFGAPIVPACYLCDDYLRLLFQGDYRASGLHIRSEYEFKGAIRYGELLTVRGRVADKQLSRGKEYITLETVVTDESGRELLWGRNVFLKAA